MANRGPDSNGSQFYFTYSSQPHLNNVNVVFGEIINGLDVLDAMEKVPVGKKHAPTVDIVLNSVIIHANPLAPHIQ